jgi:hypothetical protein
MKKVLAIILGVFLVMFLSGVVYAISNNSTSKELFGQCVAKNAKEKNTCFASVKGELKTCKAPAKEAKNKEALKQCKQTYKTAKKQCMTKFKVIKEQCRALKNSTSSIITIQ